MQGIPSPPQIAKLNYGVQSPDVIRHHTRFHLSNKSATHFKNCKSESHQTSLQPGSYSIPKLCPANDLITDGGEV